MIRNIADSFLLRTSLFIVGGAFIVYLVMSALSSMAMHAIA